MQKLESGSDLWDCKVDFITVLQGLINNLFNTKNSFLQLPSRKTTLKCEVLFKSVFFTNFFHKIVQRNVKLTQEILNLDSKVKHQVAQSIKEDIEKLRRRQQS